MNKTTIRSMASTSFEEKPSPEQQEKYSYEREDVDLAGIIQRNRVTDQTIFDVLFIRFLIEQPQHEAAHYYVEALERSGAGVQSPALDGRASVMPAHAVGDQIAQRHMSFSSAYRFMLKRVGEEGAAFCSRVTGNIFFYRRDAEFLEEVGHRLDKPLWSLAKFYKTAKRRDPRRVLRAQIGARKK